MKYVRDTTGRFTQRPHYEPSELDHECEQIISQFLTKKHGQIRFPIATDDLTVLIEREVEDLDLYADLSHEGTDVEGITYFYPKRKPKVRICRRLSEDKKRENRLRTTLTHEFGHAKFHNHVWQMDLAPQDLFSTTPSNASPKCKRDNILNAAAKDWMEWQAGYICGALLMPVKALHGFVSEFCRSNKVCTPLQIGSASATALESAIAEFFRVSEEAARVRLAKLRLLSQRDFGPSLL